MILNFNLFHSFMIFLYSNFQFHFFIFIHFECLSVIYLIIFHFYDHFYQILPYSFYLIIVYIHFIKSLFVLFKFTFKIQMFILQV